jgi:hypothetical protein
LATIFGSKIFYFAYIDYLTCCKVLQSVNARCNFNVIRFVPATSEYTDECSILLTSLSVAELEHKPFYSLFRLHGYWSLRLSFIRPTFILPAGAYSHTSFRMRVSVNVVFQEYCNPGLIRGMCTAENLVLADTSPKLCIMSHQVNK